MDKIYVGIDNGITGSIGVISPHIAIMYLTPSFQVQDFTKKKQNISRLDRNKLRNILKDFIPGYIPAIIVMERPFWNPMLSPKASKSGVMCLEAQLGIIEDLEIPYQIIDSKNWQRDLLPDGCKTSPELKKASMDIGIRLFPHLKEEIQRHKDADGILIAEWARRRGL